MIRHDFILVDLDGTVEAREVEDCFLYDFSEGAVGDVGAAGIAGSYPRIAGQDAEIRGRG